MFVNTALNYTSGKYRLLSQLLPEMDYSKKYFIDLFAGSGVVGFNIADKYKKILCNDIITDVIEIHKNIINNPIDFIEDVKQFATKTKENQEFYLNLRSSYNNDNNDIYNKSVKLYALILSCTNNFMRFNNSGKFNQTWGKRGFSISTQRKLDLFIDYISNYKDKIYFSNKDFVDVEITKPSMVYIDSPYSNTEAGYSTTWKLNDDIRLYNYCKELDKNNSSFMVSGVLLHDNKRCLLLDKLLDDGYKYKELDYNYNKVSKKGNKETIEIIIMNYVK